MDRILLFTHNYNNIRQVIPILGINLWIDSKRLKLFAEYVGKQIKTLIVDNVEKLS